MVKEKPGTHTDPHSQIIFASATVFKNYRVENCIVFQKIQSAASDRTKSDFVTIINSIPPEKIVFTTKSG